MGMYDNCFQLWWDHLDSDHTNLLTLLPLLLLAAPKTAVGLNTRYLCWISAVLFHAASNFCT
jgi:hypothetical protein